MERKVANLTLKKRGGEEEEGKLRHIRKKHKKNQKGMKRKQKRKSGHRREKKIKRGGGGQVYRIGLVGYDTGGRINRQNLWLGKVYSVGGGAWKQKQTEKIL